MRMWILHPTPQHLPCVMLMLMLNNSHATDSDLAGDSDILNRAVLDPEFMDKGT